MRLPPYNTNFFVLSAPRAIKSLWTILLHGRDKEHFQTTPWKEELHLLHFTHCDCRIEVIEYVRFQCNCTYGITAVSLDARIVNVFVIVFHTIWVQSESLFEHSRTRELCIFLGMTFTAPQVRRCPYAYGSDYDFSDSLIIHAALTRAEHLILVRWMGLETHWKRVENTAVFETISNTDANFLNLHID